MRRPTVEALAEGIRAGDRAMLARAITLVESDKPEHVAEAQELLGELLPRTGGAARVGISGVPGAGKSTFIDAFGTMLTAEGKKVAVLAIDPSSSVSGGSILGDKTRMARLSRDENAYIRPSPSSGTLGGVHRKTRETLLLCEAFGFDVILVETVGVGQSETVVADMVDVYLVLMLAGTGDELQGIKRGILEVADLLAINKADGDNERRAMLAQRELSTALRLMRGARKGGQPPVLTCSAIEGRGLREIWEAIVAHREKLAESGALEDKRRAQSVTWMWSMIEEGLLASLHHDERVKRELGSLESKVAKGEVTATYAAHAILEAYFQRPS
jgi:LAO/AO transport system kinase